MIIGMSRIRSKYKLTTFVYRSRGPVFFIGTYSDEEKLNHAWLAYMMITESDGQNWRQLRWATIVECKLGVLVAWQSMRA